MPKFVATFRVAFEDGSEAEANVAMEVLAEHMEQLSDEGDEVVLTELTEFNSAQTPAELITKIKSVRNSLLALKRKDTFEVAREIDMIAYSLDKGIEPSMIPQHYDYGGFLELAEKVWSGKNPT